MNYGRVTVDGNKRDFWTELTPLEQQTYIIGNGDHFKADRKGYFGKSLVDIGTGKLYMFLVPLNPEAGILMQV